MRVRARVSGPTLTSYGVPSVDAARPSRFPAPARLVAGACCLLLGRRWDCFQWRRSQDRHRPTFLGRCRPVWAGLPSRRQPGCRSDQRCRRHQWQAHYPAAVRRAERHDRSHQRGSEDRLGFNHRRGDGTFHQQHRVRHDADLPEQSDPAGRRFGLGPEDHPAGQRVAFPRLAHQQSGRRSHPT